jgi:hypothetical protein
MYFDESSTARTAVGIKPPKRALAAATPPPSNEDFISDRRLKLKCKTSFWGLRLLYLSMDLAPVRQPRCNFETGSGRLLCVKTNQRYCANGAGDGSPVHRPEIAPRVMVRPEGAEDPRALSGRTIIE